jgi:hypothetical protein
MNVEDMARHSGATDANGDRAVNVFCFTKSELEEFQRRVVRECITAVRTMRQPSTLNYSVGDAAAETILLHFNQR